MRLILAALLVACAGCAMLDPRAASYAAVDAALDDALKAARAPQAEQRALLARAQQAFAQDASGANRLRLATLLAMLPAPLGDAGRAGELLAPIADAGSPGAGRFAALLAAQLAEEQRLAREAERVERESERAARDRERADRDRDKREETLRQQLEALRSIERNIEEREQRLRRGSR